MHTSMSNRQRLLWNRLESFVVGEAAAALTFVKRLARDNAWSENFAARVFAEYKRFVFLMAEAGHPVTPSDEVDQAWHLHMVYTESYWHDLCQNVLGRPLHHGPTRGGRAEGDKFSDWYARTLQSYERFFGSRPPSDVWPEAAVRFGRAPHFARVNLAENWVLPKVAVRKRASIAASALLCCTLVGCGLVAVQQNQAAMVPYALLTVVGVVAVIMIGSVVGQYKPPKTRGGRRLRWSRDTGCGGPIVGAPDGGEASSGHRHSGHHSHGHHSHGHHSHGHHDSSGHHSHGDGGHSGSHDSGSSGCASSGCGSSGCGSSGCGGSGCGGGGGGD